jgi:S1-C subfamily serine protease
MRRAALYSSGRPRPEHPPGQAALRDSPDHPPPSGPPPTLPASHPPPRSFFRTHLDRFVRLAWVTAGVSVAAALLMAAHLWREPALRLPTQKDIDAAVLHTLATRTLPSAAARAYDVIRPSVVRVNGLGHDHEGEEDAVRGIGSGVVILDSGVILTNLHVVSGARRLQVVFHDGSQSEAAVVRTQPEHDLAVIRAATVPDDLVAATLTSTRDLAPGDEVVAVGFPFGIGPSVTAGVVSGLRREFRSPEGQQVLTNLIQFDAAANPGSSGGPLVTTDGNVVGIVTAILNPHNQGVFAGIGFAVPIENAAAAVGLPPF